MPEAELQAKVLSLSNELLSTNTELQAVQEQLRNAWRELGVAKQQLSEQTAANERLHAEITARTQKVATMENELADLSSSLVSEANSQVSEANRRAAAAHRLVTERDDVISAQSAELLALKIMLERITEHTTEPNLETTPPPSIPASETTSPRPSALTMRRRIGADPTGEVTQALILDLDAYASPTRPLMRTDLPDFMDFLDLWGCLHNLPKPTLFHLQTDPWRKSVLVNRIIREDIEPTLRADKSPHLSYLNMRQYVSSVMDQTIALEPVHSKDKAFSRRPSLPCVLCGEQRNGDKYERVYHARLTRDGDKLVLDLGCVAKTRLACELAGFLRSIAKRAPASHSHRVLAWRQLNSMREQLFWARTGGLFPDSNDLLEAVQQAAVSDFAFDPQTECRYGEKSPPKLGGVTSLAVRNSSEKDNSEKNAATNSQTSLKYTEEATTRRGDDLPHSKLPTPNTPLADRVEPVAAKSLTEIEAESRPSNPELTDSTIESATSITTTKTPGEATSIDTAAEPNELSKGSVSHRSTPAEALPVPAEVVDPVGLPETGRANLNGPFVHLNESVESGLDVFQETSETVPSR